MIKLKLRNSGERPRSTVVTRLRLLGLLVVLVISVFSFSRVYTNTRVLAAPSGNLNFQARLLGANGAIVADGYYNVQFKLYSAASGGTPVWTENRIDTNGVTAGNDFRLQVKSGYLSVGLGELSAFTGVNFDQDLWLTMNIGGTTQTATPTYDGEMNPRLKLTSVPYAQQANRATTAASADTLNKTTGGFTGNVNFGTLTADRNYLFPDTSLATTASPGTICVFNGANSNCPAASGSAFYVQNDTALQPQSNFNIQARDSGTAGTIGGVIRGAAAGQTVDLIQFLNSAGSTVASVSASGTSTFSGLTVNGTSTFNGSTSITGTNTLTVGTGATTLGGILGVTGATTLSSTLAVTGTSTFTGLGTFNGGLTVASNSNFSQTGTGSFSTGTGAISLNGLPTITTTTTTTTTLGQKDSRLILQNNSFTPNAGGEIVLGAIADTNTGRYAAIGTNIKVNNGSGGAVGDVYIATKAVTTDAALTARLTIQAAGNVGIGTTDPASLFSVGSASQFQVNSSGAITTTDGYTQSGTTANTFSGVSTFSAAGTGLSVTNNATIGGTLSVTGATTIGSTLAVTGTSTYTGLGTFNGGLNVAAASAYYYGGTGSPLSLELSRTTPTVVNDFVEIGNFNISAGAHNIRVSLTQSDSSFSVAKTYILPVSFSATAGVWESAIPIADTGGFVGNDVGLDITVSGNVASLRLRRTAGTTGGTTFIRVESVGKTSGIFTATSVTGTAVAPTALYGGLYQNVNTNNVGVGTTAPTQRLDVQGGNINTSGNILTGNTTRLTNTGVLQNVTNADASTFFTGGTLADARLSTNVALLNSNQTFTGAKTFSAAGTGLAVTNNATVGGTLSVTGWLRFSNGVSDAVPNIYTDVAGTQKFRLERNGTVRATGLYLSGNGDVINDPYTLSVDTSGNLATIGNITTSGNILTGNTTRLTNTGVLQNVTNADAGTFFTGGTLANARLVNSGALTVTAGTGLSGGGSITLGGTSTLNLANTAVTIGTYGNSTSVGQFTVDQQGRITGATNVAIAGLGSCSTCVSLQTTTPGTAQTGNINVSGTIIAGSFSGNGAALTDLNASNLATGTVPSAVVSGSYSGITGTGALTTGSIAAGFGTIATANTIQGTTLNGTTGINTGAGAGTQRIDATGNLLNIGNITGTSLEVTNNATVGGTSTFTGLGTFNGGLTSSTSSTTALQVTNGTTAALSVDTTVGTTTLRGATTASDAAVVGAELVTDQDFSNATFWTCTGWTTTTTSATHTTGNTTACSSTASNFAVVAGATYQVSFTLAGNTTATDTVTPSIGGVSAPALGATGTTTQTVVITGTSTANLSFTPTTNFNGTISAVSVIRITKSSSVLTVLTSTGTTDLEVRTNGTNNQFIGVRAGQSNTTGFQNTATGTNSLQANTTGSNNTATGSFSLQNNTTGINNTATGLSSLQNNTTGSSNTATGLNSLRSNTTGSNNTATGSFSLQNNTTGINNTATGVNSLLLNTTGSSNTATGVNSLRSNTTGINNTATGLSSLFSNTTGVSNTATGLSSLFSNTTGVSNTATGVNSLLLNTTGSSNTATGTSSLLLNTTGSSNTATGLSSLRNLKTLTGTISATATNAGNAQFTSSSTTGLVAGASITITGTTSYNGARTILSVDTATSFTISTAFSTADTTGSWTTANTDNNTAFGLNAGQGSSNGYSAVGNSLFGFATGNALQTGADYNSLFGYSAGLAITTGKNNTIFGYNAGTTLTSGSNNILIGQGVNAASATGSDQLNIGNLITGVLTAGSQSLTVNGALTVTTGQNFTINGDAFTDLTGSGLTLSGGALTVDSTSATGFFRNGGNSFGAAATLGTNDAFDLNFRTGGTTKLTVTSAGSVGVGITTSITGKLQVVSAIGNNTVGLVVNQNDTTNNNRAAEITNAGTGASFYVGDDGTNIDSSPFIIDASGNVVIGRASTVEKLDVLGTTLFQNSADTATVKIRALAGQTTNLLELQNSAGTALTEFTQLGGRTSGTFGIGTAGVPTAAQLNLTTTNAANIGLQLNGITGQTADYLQIRDSTSTTLLSFTASGVLKVGTSATPTLGTAKLLVTDAEVTTRIRVGDSTNGINFNDTGATGGSASKFRKIGTARDTERVTLVPEYQGATLTQPTTNSIGSMSSDFCSDSLNINDSATSPYTAICPNTGGTEEHNFYTWTASNNTTAQSYYIFVRSVLPSNFSGFSSANSIQMYGWGSDVSQKVILDVYRNGTLCGIGNQLVSSTNSTWNLATHNGDETACGFVAGDTVTFRVTTTSQSSGFARAGEIMFDYLSSF